MKTDSNETTTNYLTATVKPIKAYMNNCKAMRIICEENYSYGQPLRFPTLAKKKARITIELTPDKDTTSKETITNTDRMVMDAIYTIYMAGSDTFTTENVIRVMFGDMNLDITGHKKTLITDSIEKLSHINLRMDCTEEMIERKRIKKGETWVFSSALLPLEKVTIKSGNNQCVMRGYILTDVPIIYKYAETINQLVSFPFGLLYGKKAGISNTFEALQVRRYLIQRIELMKNSRNKMLSKEIVYYRVDHKNKEKGLIPALGYSIHAFTNGQWRKIKSRVHNLVIKNLECFLMKEYISSYDIVTQGQQKIKGIHITL